MARTSIELGYELLSQGRLQEARTMLERAVSEFPKEARAHLYLAMTLDQLNETARAEKHFTHAIALDPNDAFVFYNWGIFLHRQGRLQEALRAYERAYQLDPTLVAALQAATGLRQALGIRGAPMPGAPLSVKKSAPASGWVMMGILFALSGLCAPWLGLVGGIACGIIAMLQGAVKRGLVVIVLSIVMASLGACAGMMMREAIQGMKTTQYHTT